MKKGLLALTMVLAGCGDNNSSENTVQSAAALVNSKAPLSSSERKSAALDFADKVSTQFTACRVQAAAFALAIKNHDRLTAFEAAGHGVEFCSAAASQYGSMTAPESLAGDPENTFPLVIEACGEAARDQSETFRQMQKALDTERLSDMAELDSQSRKAGSSLDLCRTRIRGVSIAFGASEKEADKIVWVIS
jgi:hypothetical protein